MDASHRNYGRHSKATTSPNVMFIMPLFALILAINIQTAASLLCYKCTSNEPGCTLDKVDWLIHSAKSCPRNNDKCVKIIEQRGAELQVIRGCLSDVMPYRRDIPADHFEGCRPSSKNPSKAVYVFNEIKELELKQRYHNNVTYCFCEFDHWCNSAPGVTMDSRQTFMMIILTIAIFSAVNRFWAEN